MLLKDPHMFGYCCTQLIDVFQEQNGIHRFDRGRKLDMVRIRAAQLRPAAIEEADPERRIAGGPSARPRRRAPGGIGSARW
ncbi:hypothetical protein AQJ11_32705 [Streptomyces corchorusii]|uniref:Uncharacterized protein n=1 Tax=Streptomyces corchorusii TaxID=1903 RepID=A0A124HK97_STRCK|nr:hypothetical protein AQJ11_32705 [Streptomyces corchorusii]